MENILAIFNEAFQTIAFLNVAKGERNLEVRDQSWTPRLQKALSFLTERLPLHGAEEVLDKKILLTAHPIEVGNPAYLYAVRSELEKLSILSYVVVPELKDILILLSSDRVTKDQREAVLGDIVNMTEEQAKIFAESLALAR